jgi:dUTP pyrophosphatase
VALANTPGVIDSGYRGELQAVVINLDPVDDYQIRRGDRIAQLLVQRVELVSWNVVDALTGEDRGGGFGHSGR